jgi:hypothetical protein
MEKQASAAMIMQASSLDVNHKKTASIGGFFMVLGRFTRPPLQLLNGYPQVAWCAY